MPGERQAGHKGNSRKRVQKPGQVNALAAKYLRQRAADSGQKEFIRELGN